MTREEILRVVGAWARAVETCDVGAFEQLVTPALREPVVARTRAIHAAFGEVEVRALAHQAVVEDDTVAWRWRLSGVHVGSIGGIAPSGARRTIEGVNVQRMLDGTVVDHWTLVDLAPLQSRT